MMPFILLLFLVIPLSSLQAEDAKTFNFSLGTGITIKKNLRLGNTYEHMDKKIIYRPIPFIQASYGRLSLGAQGLSFMGIGNRLMNISAFINRAGDRYHGVGMTPRKESFFAGVSLKFFKYGLNLSRDINGRSKGFLAKFDYSEMLLKSEDWIFRTNLSIDWYDDRYAQYYYGVEAFEVRVNRPQYRLNNYAQFGLGLMSIYKINSNTSLTAIISSKLVSKKVSQAPTMNKDRIDLGGIIGLSYQF